MEFFVLFYDLLRIFRKIKIRNIEKSLKAKKQQKKNLYLWENCNISLIKKSQILKIEATHLFYSMYCSPRPIYQWAVTNNNKIKQKKNN